MNFFICRVSSTFSVGAFYGIVHKNPERHGQIQEQGGIQLKVSSSIDFTMKVGHSNNLIGCLSQAGLCISERRAADRLQRGFMGVIKVWRGI